MSQVFYSGCGGPSIELLDDWHINVDGQGIVTHALPTDGGYAGPGYQGQPASPRGIAQWADLIWQNAIANSIPAPLVAATMALESRGQQNVVSFDGGYGLMQLTSAKAKQGHSNDDLINDPNLNISLGCQMLSTLWQQYGNNPIQAATAYNAGHVGCGTPKGCSAPNEYNVISWCNKQTGVTNDYPGQVIAFWNGAVDGGFGPNDAPQPASDQTTQDQSQSDLSSASSSGGGWWPKIAVVAAVGIAFGGAYVWQTRRR